MRYFLPINNIDKINLYIIDINIYPIYPKIHFIYLIYSYLISNFG